MDLETIANWATVLTAFIAVIAAVGGVWYSTKIRSERRRIASHYLKLLTDSEEKIEKALEAIDDKQGAVHVRDMSLLINLVAISNTSLIGAYSNLMLAKAEHKLPTPRLRSPVVLEWSSKP